MRNSHLSAAPAVLVAHGSPDPRSALVVRAIAAASGCHATFLEFDSPGPVETLEALADTGHRRVRVIPLLLTHAYHGRVDIPRVVEDVRQSRPGLAVSVSDTVGDRALLPALARGAPAGSDSLVLAAAGTRDPAAQHAIGQLSDSLAASLGLPSRVGYAAAAPDVGGAVRGAIGAGARGVAVVSYFIAPGALHDRVRHHAFAAGAATVSGPLGAASELVDVITRRRQCTPVAWRTMGDTSSAAVPTPTTHVTMAAANSPAPARK